MEADYISKRRGETYCYEMGYTISGLVQQYNHDKRKVKQHHPLVARQNTANTHHCERDGHKPKDKRARPEIENRQGHLHASAILRILLPVGGHARENGSATRTEGGELRRGRMYLVQVLRVRERGTSVLWIGETNF